MEAVAFGSYVAVGFVAEILYLRRFNLRIREFDKFVYVLGQAALRTFFWPVYLVNLVIKSLFHGDNDLVVFIFLSAILAAACIWGNVRL